MPIGSIILLQSMNKVSKVCQVMHHKFLMYVVIKSNKGRIQVKWLTVLSAQHKWQFMNNELEIMWKESIMSYKYYTRQQHSLSSTAWDARKVYITWWVD